VPELVVSSPLTRAIQTCLLVLPGVTAGARRVVACPLCAEHLEASCDIGRPASQLRFAFPQVDFSDLAEVWWYVPEDWKGLITPSESQRLFTNDGRRESRGDFTRRVESFAYWLAERPEKDIAVFAHADFCNCFLERFFSHREARFSDYWMSNCEVVEVELQKEDLYNPVLQPGAPAKQEVQVPAPVEKPPNLAVLSLEALRQELLKKHPSLKPAVVRAMAAKEWTTMGEEARQQYMNEIFLRSLEAQAEGSTGGQVSRGFGAGSCRIV